MKCQNCKAFYHYEDDGDCYISNLKQNKNGEYRDGCKLLEKTVLKIMNEKTQDEFEFYDKLEG